MFPDVVQNRNNDDSDYLRSVTLPGAQMYFCITLPPLRHRSIFAIAGLHPLRITRTLIQQSVSIYPSYPQPRDPTMLNSWRLYIVLLALTGLLADAESKITAPNFHGAARSITTKRLLRVHKAAVDDKFDKEERGVFANVVGGVVNAASNARLSWDIQTWLNSNTKVDDVFNNLQLNLAKDKLFENPHWKPFTEYVAKLNQNDPVDSTVTALMRIYDNVGLSKMLATAKKVPSTEAEAMKWEAARLNFWLNKKADPEEIFKVLQLNKATNDLFDSPQFATWATYLKMFNENNPPDKKISMVGAFARSYGEEKLMKALVSAENANSAGATKLKNEMLQAWMDFTTSPNQVFKVLKLDKEGDNLLSSPLLSTWVEYLNLFNKGLPTKKTTMIATFTKNYGDEGLAMMLEKAKATSSTKEFATNLQNAQFNHWMSEGKSPKTILDDVLKLDSKTFLADDLSGDIWRAYAKNSPDAELSVGIWRAYSKAYTKNFPESGFAFQP